MTKAPEGMVVVPGGRVRVGSDEHYPEERPARTVEVRTFAIDITPVTNEAFAAFVAATSHVTTAELSEPAGSAVFAMTAGPVDLHDPSNWWSFCAGASWRRPAGPGSDISGREKHPVVHVGLDDARAYAKWCGKRLPDEAEWEAAARGGLDGATYAWGEEFAPGGTLMANVWTGMFPWYFAREGNPGTTAVGAWPAGGYGTVDMIGNVWEWTRTRMNGERACGCAPEPSGAEDPSRLVVLKGGSYLCAGEYCARYRPAARIALTPGTATAHVGFRCAMDL